MPGPTPSLLGGTLLPAQSGVLQQPIWVLTRAQAALSTSAQMATDRSGPAGTCLQGAGAVGKQGLGRTTQKEVWVRQGGAQLGPLCPLWGLGAWGVRAREPAGLQCLWHGEVVTLGQPLCGDQRRGAQRPERPQTSEHEDPIMCLMLP